jgi:hypothetical protein
MMYFRKRSKMMNPRKPNSRMVKIRKKIPRILALRGVNSREAASGSGPDAGLEVGEEESLEEESVVLSETTGGAP